MNEAYLTFRSVTSAMEALRLLNRSGIRANLRRTPEAIRSRGCGYSLGVAVHRAEEAMQVLRSREAFFEKCFYRERDGSWREVAQ